MRRRTFITLLGAGDAPWCSDLLVTTPSRWAV